MEREVQPLSESLGLPDVFPHLPECPEDALTAQSLQHGYQHDEAAALGFGGKRELQLTLTDQPPGFYSQASLAYWRKALRQQLQGPARHLVAKRKAHVAFDVPLGAGGGPSSTGGSPVPPSQPRFPQQPTRGVATREAAEAWARQHLAAPGAPPLRALGWGSGGEAGQVPHGFPRTTRIFELLAELAPPLPRALWFLRVIYLNRTRPVGWDGAGEVQQRTKQLTEELLAFLEAAAPALQAARGQAAAPGRPPRPGGSATHQEQEQHEDAARGAGALPQQWVYGVRLAGHCCSAGLLDAARLAEWAAAPRMQLALPAAAQRDVQRLLERSLPAAQLAQQQVVSLLECCLTGAEAAGQAASRAGAQPGWLARGAANPADVQRGLLRAAAQLVELHPAAFVAADEQLLQPLLAEGGAAARQCAASVAGTRQRLSQALHARVLHWHDAKAMQLLDAQLAAGGSAAAAAGALTKLLSQQPAAAAGPPPLGEAVRVACEWAVAAPAADFGAALAEVVDGTPAAGQRQQQQQQQQQQQVAQQQVGQQQDPQMEQAGKSRGAAALLSERVLFALGVLHTLQAQQAQQAEQQQQLQQQGDPQQRQAEQQQQQQQQDPQQRQQLAGDGAAEAQPPPLQAAIFRWLDLCAGEPAQQQQPWRRQRLVHLTLLLAEASLLCPAAYLSTCLANGAFQPSAAQAAAAAAAAATSPAAAAMPPAVQPAAVAVDVGHAGSGSSSGGSSASRAGFHLHVLEQLHPMLEYPTLAGAANSKPAASSSNSWPLARLQYASTRAAVLGQYRPAVPAAAAEVVAAAAEEQQAAEWERLLNVPTPGNSSSGGGTDDDSSDSDAEFAAGRGPQRQRAWQRWVDLPLLALQQRMIATLGIDSAVTPAAGGTAGGMGLGCDSGTAHEGSTDDAAQGASVGQLLKQLQSLEVWQQRHTAGALLAASKAFLASTDAGSSGRPSPSPPPLAGPGPNPRWLLHALAALQACGGHREALSLVSTCLNLLQRAVAAAVRATTGGQQAQQAQRPDLAEALVQAQRRWHQRSRVAPSLLFALLSAHAGALAASDIVPKLMPMLTGGLWRLQQPQHQQAARQALAGQLDLAAHLLALPGSSLQQWLAKMEEQHGRSHWAMVQLQQRAAACRAQRGGGSGAATQQQLQQAAAACLQSFLQCAGELEVAAGASQGVDGNRGIAASVSEQPAHSPNGAVRLLGNPYQAAHFTEAAVNISADTDIFAAALEAVQQSVAPAALPAVLQQFGGRDEEPGTSLPQRLLALGPAATQALLREPQLAHSALHHHAHLPSTAGSSSAASWQLAIAMFASAGGLGGSSGSRDQRVLRLNAGEAMAAAVAAATPATARCCWLLLRLLLDEQQRQGGHRLAEAERQLAARVAHEAVRRPEAAAALAATLCSLSPSAAAGQQLLVEVESMLRHPVVDLESHAAPHTQGGKPLVASAALPPPRPTPPPPPFGGEQGLVEAALVCLSTGSSAERQHVFAQHLIRQLAALADVALGEQGQALGYGVAPASPASPAAVQVSAWLRLAMLLPLLPLVYKHRSADAAGGLRGQLLRALLRLLAAPAVCADAAAAAHACIGTIGSRAAATAAAAAAAAGEPLPQRLLHLLRALLVGGWASWMRLEGGKLRDVAPYEHSRQLAGEASGLPLAPRLQAAVTAALPLSQQNGLVQVAACSCSTGVSAARAGNASGAAAGPAAAQRSGGSVPSAWLALDPWLLLEGGTASGNAAPGDGVGITQAVAPASGAGQPPAAPPRWLECGVKRRRRDLAYMPAPAAAAGPLPTVAEQLRRQHEAGADAMQSLEGGGSADLAALAANLFGW